MNDTTLADWRNRLAQSNLEAVKRLPPIGPEHASALDSVLRAVALGATLQITRSVLAGSFVAELESSSGARHAKAEGSQLGAVLEVLAERWSGK